MLIVAVALVGCLSTKATGVADYVNLKTGEKYDLDKYNSMQKGFYLSWYKCREYAERSSPELNRASAINQATEKCMLKKGYKKIIR